MSQGKAWNKEEVIKLLKPKFKLGYSINKSCRSIGLPPSTFINWLDHDDVLCLKVEKWKNDINDDAIKNLRQKIKDGDADISKWWLEKRHQDFSNKTENLNVNVDAEALSPEREEEVRNALNLISRNSAIETQEKTLPNSKGVK